MPIADRPPGDGSDASGAPVDLIGKFACEISLDLALGADGGARPSGVKLLSVWALQSRADGRIADAAWQLCDVPIPDLVDVPIETLNPAIAWSTATLSRVGGDPHADFLPLPFIAGAVLADPRADALPAGAAPRCSASIKNGCVTVDAASGQPGVPVAATGLSPDADVVYLDLRVRIDGAAFTFRLDHSVDGRIGAAEIEAHVLGCHLRSGGTCTPAEVARLEAAHPPLSVTGSSLRTHVQGFYFTCPQLVADPEGSLTAAEGPVDAGASDLAGAPPPTFASAIQGDLDRRGCATGGCHETFSAATGKLHLVYQPPSVAGVMQNYQAVLPWTTGSPLGGRFVNEVPLPPAMMARWRAWVTSGAPY